MEGPASALGDGVVVFAHRGMEGISCALRRNPFELYDLSGSSDQRF